MRVKGLDLNGIGYEHVRTRTGEDRYVFNLLESYECGPPRHKKQRLLHLPLPCCVLTYLNYYSILSRLCLYPLIPTTPMHYIVVSIFFSISPSEPGCRGKPCFRLCPLRRFHVGASYRGNLSWLVIMEKKMETTIY